jgi:non-canonical (house-cleaning) NTP pyrophosphatase
MEKISSIENIKEKEGAIGYFTNNQIIRSDIFVHIVKLLYGQYLFKKGGKQ